VSELSRLPARLVAGTTCDLRVSDPEHAADDGWVAKLWLRGPSAPAAVEITADAEHPDEHLFKLTAEFTGPLLPGSYQGQVIATHATLGTALLLEGRVLVTPNLATALAGELQNPTERELALVTALIEGRTVPGEDLEGYTIDGTAYTLVSYEQLCKRQAYLRRMLNRRRHGSLSMIRLGVTRR